MSQANVVPRTWDGHIRVELSGEIDMANADHVESQIHAAIGNHETRVVVDLTDVSYIDSAGLRVLAMLATRLEQIHVALHLAAPEGSPARRVMELAGLPTFAPDET